MNKLSVNSYKCLENRISIFWSKSNQKWISIKFKTNQKYLKLCYYFLPAHPYLSCIMYSIFYVFRLFISYFPQLKNYLWNIIISIIHEIYIQYSFIYRKPSQYKYLKISMTLKRFLDWIDCLYIIFKVIVYLLSPHLFSRK